MHYTTLDLTTPSKMTEATYNFRLDTLIHEIELHPHREELLDLMVEQVFDEMSTQYME
jgi:hypothetical protein